jgi:lipopolysaccharide transport system permease protein
MSNSTHQAIFSITGNGALLKKTYLPKYIFTVSKSTSGLVDFVFSLGALIIVMLVTKSPFNWYMLLFPLVLVQLYIFNVGLGLFLSQANVFFRDVQYIYNAITTAWMYLTPILYPIELLPSWLGWIVTHFNPMYFYVEQFRDIVYYCRFIRLDLMLAGTVTALLMLVVGILCFRRSQDRFILYI